MLDRILAYHPEIVVKKENGEIFVIELDMDDWYENQHVLKKLIKASSGKNMGDVVKAIESKKFNLGYDDGIIRVRIKKTVSEFPTIVTNWSDGEFNGVG